MYICRVIKVISSSRVMTFNNKSIPRKFFSRLIEGEEV